MTPLCITAYLSDAIVLTHGTIHLDSLLAAMYALVHRLPPLEHGEDPGLLPLPLGNEPGGRFHLASASVSVVEQYESRHFHKAFPVDVARYHTKMKTVNVTAGVNKSHRIPLSAGHTDTLRWWCMGEKEGIEGLLQYCHHLGRKRNHGYGKVSKWTVEPCDVWDGFPLVLDGKPLRNLPVNWPGLVEPEVMLERLSYPYWDNAPNKTLCVVPVVEC